MDYPPEPWDLRGQLHASAFLVPIEDVPLDLPAGWTPLRILGRAVVGAAWVAYEPPSVLTYSELMATVLARRGRLAAVHVVRIWVDSPASRDGGRELWGIPKELASFTFDGGAFRAGDDRGEIARGTVRPRLRLPGRWPLGFSLVQRLAGAAKISPVGAAAALEFASATFAARPGGPLGFLAGRRPWLTFTLRDFVMSFGGVRDGSDAVSRR